MAARRNVVHSRHLQVEDDIDAAYDSSTNDNDKDNDSQDRQDRDGKIPDRGRRAPGYKDESIDNVHVYCFVPGEGIDVVVLAQYLRRWVDGTATIQASKHPTDPSKIGYTVGASATLNRESLEILLDDTRKWNKEQSSRDFRRNPYDYVESDTFTDRKKRGPANSKPAALARPRRQEEPRGAAAGVRVEIEDSGAMQRQLGRTSEAQAYGGRHTDKSYMNRGPDPDPFEELSLSGRSADPSTVRGGQRGSYGGGRHSDMPTYSTSRPSGRHYDPLTPSNAPPAYGDRHDPTARPQALRL